MQEKRFDRVKTHTHKSQHEERELRDLLSAVSVTWFIQENHFLHPFFVFVFLGGDGLVVPTNTLPYSSTAVPPSTEETGNDDDLEEDNLKARGTRVDNEAELRLRPGKSVESERCLVSRLALLVEGGGDMRVRAEEVAELETEIVGTDIEAPGTDNDTLVDASIDERDDPVSEEQSDEAEE